MSAPDRTRPPGPGEAPRFHLPPLWHAELPSGVRAVGTASRGETATAPPIVSLTLAFPAGRLRETTATAGIAALTAAMLREGTAPLDGVALQDELDGLGALFRVPASDDAIELTLVTLTKHLPRACALLEEIALEPRFAKADFEREKERRLVEIDSRRDHPDRVAADAWAAVTWGEDRVGGLPAVGTRATVEAVTRGDVEAFWRRALAPRELRLSLVGGVDAEDLPALFPRLASLADEADPAPTASLAAPLPERVAAYLVDLPGAPQTHLCVGHPGVAATHPDFFPLIAMNYPLGGGSLSSRLNLNLREEKGWTYGVHSGFDGGLEPGTFRVEAAVHTDATAAAAAEIVRELERFREGVTDDEVEFTRKSLGRTLLRQYEPLGAKAALAHNVAKYGWPDDYPARRLAWLERMTRADLDDLAARHLHPDRLAVVAVGDGARIRPGLEALGGGAVTELERASAG